MDKPAMLAPVLAPFLLFVVVTALAAIRYVVIKYFPESRLKRFLLKDV